MNRVTRDDKADTSFMFELTLLGSRSKVSQGDHCVK